MESVPTYSSEVEQLLIKNAAIKIEKIVIFINLVPLLLIFYKFYILIEHKSIISSFFILFYVKEANQTTLDQKHPMG